MPSLSESQITAMAGGPTLRIVALASQGRGARMAPLYSTQKAPQRLGKALVDSGLATPLLIEVAQMRQSAIYQVQTTHLKALGSYYDSVSILVAFHFLPD